MVADKEIWVDIKGYEGLYQINKSGKVRKISDQLHVKYPKIFIDPKRKHKKIRLYKGGGQQKLSVPKLLREHKHIFDKKENQIDLRIKEILEVVSDHYNIQIENILNEGRDSENIVLARQICHKLAKETTKLSLSKIGYQIGKKAHATVLHSIKSVGDRIDTDKEVARDYVHLFIKLKNNTDTPITKRIEELIPL